MDQSMKTEVILGLIASIRSKICLDIYNKKKKGEPSQLFLGVQNTRLEELEEILDHFYQKQTISDVNFNRLVEEILGGASPLNG